MKYWLIALSFLTLHTFAIADEITASINNHAVEGTYSMYFNNGFNLDFSGFHGVDDNVKNADATDPSFYKIKDDHVTTDIIAVSMFANGRQNNLRTHFGGKLFGLASDYHNQMHGLALAGAIDVYVHPNVFFTGALAYAPDILTGGDFTNYYEVDGRANFQVIRNASFFLGYKLMAATFDYPSSYKHGSGTRDFFNGVYLGFRFNL